MSSNRADKQMFRRDFISLKSHRRGRCVHAAPLHLYLEPRASFILGGEGDGAMLPLQPAQKTRHVLKSENLLLPVTSSSANDQ